MRKIQLLTIILLLIFFCIGTVHAEDTILDDNSLSNLNSTNSTYILVDNISHSHTQISNLINPPVKTATLTASGGTFTQLQSIIDSASDGDTIEITGDYTYNSATDSSLINGVVISKSLTFNGNAHTISGNNLARIFNINSGEIYLYNLSFLNSWSNSADYSGALNLYGNNIKLTVNYCNISDNFVKANNANAAGINARLFDTLIVNNSYFDNNANGGGQYNVGGALSINNGNNFKNGNVFILNNSVFNNNYMFNVTGITRGAAVYVYEVDAVSITNCVFNNNGFINSASTYGGAINFYTYYWSFNNVNVTNNMFYCNNGTYGVIASGQFSSGVNGDFNNNWFGSSSPDFSTLLYGIATPETYLVLNVTNTTPVTGIVGDSVEILASLNTVYNRTSGTYTRFTGIMPEYTMFLSSVGGFFNTTSPVTFRDNVSVLFTYTSDKFYLEVTIDNETLYFGTGDIGINITVSDNNPQLLDIITYNITVSSYSPLITDNVNVYFDNNFQYISHNCSYGSYNPITQIWNLSTLNSWENKSILIKVRVPYNESLINNPYNTMVIVNGSVTSNPLEANNTVTITAKNITEGSYTLLQSLIDSTSDGGILNLPFNILYNPDTDASLINGVCISKSITIQGNGFNISGDSKARIFNITNGNIIIENLSIINSWSDNFEYCGAVNIWNYDVNLTINYCNFTNNHVIVANAFAAGINARKFGTLTVNNSYFENNSNGGGQWNVGGAISVAGENNVKNGKQFILNNSIFIGNYIHDTYGMQRGAAVFIYEVDSISITNNIFQNNSLKDTSTGYGGAIDFYSYGWTFNDVNVTNNAFVDNYGSSGSAIACGQFSDGVNGNFNNNWYGTNTPNFNTLYWGINQPETWIIMNFTSPQSFSTTGDTIPLTATLSTIYNSTSGKYTELTEELPTRTITFNSNYGSFSTSTLDITKNTTTTFTYTGSPNTLQITAKIDNQTLTLQLSNLDLKLNVNTLTPQIGSIIQFTINITNTGSTDITYTPGLDAVIIKLPIPSQLTFESTTGNYTTTDNIWYVGNLTTGETKSINITVKVPSNPSIVGNNILINASTPRYHFISTKNVEDTITLNITTKTSGSYTELQELIDSTPTGSTLSVPWNVIYDPITDAWLQTGMKLNKTIMLEGNGFTIDGLNQSRIFMVSADNVTINNVNFYGGYAPNAPVDGYIRGGAIFCWNVNFNVSNCNFSNCYAYYAAVMQNWQTGWIIENCSFTNSSTGGDILSVHDWSTGLITGCSFIGLYGGEELFWLGSHTFKNNVFVNNTGVIHNNGGTFESNWWGSNTPVFSTYGINPQTWVIMNFTNLNPINSSGGVVTLLTTLDTIYNSSSAGYSKLNGSLPTREVTYSSTSPSLNHLSSNIVLNDTNNFTYASGLTYLLINATIDNQILNISTSDISVIINVSNDNPTIAQTVTYTINVTNSGPDTAKDVVVNFKIPSDLQFMGDTSGGNYNHTEGVWFIGNLTSGTTIILNISARIPFNYSLINNVYWTPVNITGTFADLNNNNDKDTCNITINNITKGSYTILQYLIDMTPSGTTLNVPFNITYDPITDAWLQTGMKLNKTIMLEGNGFTIDGLNQSRIFMVSADNVTINNVNFYGGYAPNAPVDGYIRGGAIFCWNVNFNVSNCNFSNCYAYYAAVMQNWQTGWIIENCSFTNSSTGGDIFSVHDWSTGLITGCSFIGLYGGEELFWLGSHTFKNNIFVNNTGVIHNKGGTFESNWWGNNTPDFSTYGINPQTWVIMNFTNITPITYSGGVATLQVNLDTIYNKTTNATSPLIGDIPQRNVIFNWTQGTVNPSNSTILRCATASFTYPSSMGAWFINATIDNQILTIGSADIEIIIVPNKNPVNDGDNITFNITVRNNGFVKASDINLTLHIPYGLINITTYANNGTLNNTTMIWTIGDLNVLENVTLTLNGTLNNPGKYLLLNASIDTNHFYDDNLANHNVTCNVTVIQWSDLEIFKNVSDSHPDTKDNITYIITVTNYGPSTAHNVTVFDNLSSKLIFQYYNSTNGTYNATTGIWFINNMTPNSTETLNITVLINESGITENFVNVSSPNNDTNWTNNYANITFETAPLSDLWVTINMEPQTSNFITFHIQAGNNGIEPANGTIVELNISNLMVYVNHTTDSGVYGCSTGVWDIGYLKVNETVNLTLILQLDFPAGLNVTNITTSANITSWSTDLYPENNTDNITFEAEIYGNFRLLQQLIDNQPANTVFVLPRSFAYDPINDAFKDTDTYDLINGVSIYKNLTIVNPDGYTIGGFGMARCLNITAPNVILDGLKIADGYSPLGAGLNIPASNVQVLRTNFTNNVLWGDYGGAIYVSGNNVLIQDNYFERNNASKLGGAIGVLGASNLRILNNTFINNTAKSDDLSGGAIGILNSTATVNTNVFLDNNATSSTHIASAIYTNNSNVNLEANWYGNNTPDMTTDELIYGNKPETWIMLDWEFVNQNMTGVELNVVFVLYNSTSGEKTPINYGLHYRKLNVTSRDPTLSWYNTTYTGNNSVNYTYNTLIPTYQINATVDYETISLEFSTLLNVYKTLVNDTIWFGDNLIYNITIVNYGPHNTQTLMVEDLIPPGLTINNLIKTTGSTSQIGGNVYWGLVVPAGTSTTLLINTTPTAEGNYTNSITINTTTPLDYFINGTNKTVTGHVLGLSDLEVNLTISNPPYYVGENIVYNVRVANYGPSVAENIIVNMPVSTGLTYLYQDWPGTYSQSTGLWNIASLNPGDILDINITFRINSLGWYNQTINITSDSVDTNLSNNNKTLNFNVTNQVDLILNMTINKGETLYGDDSVYITLNIYNRGPSAADNVTVFLYHTGLDYWYAPYGYGSFIVDTPTAGRWMVGTLNANTSTYITLRFVANTLGNFTINGRANNTYNDSKWLDNYANVTINVLKYADLIINKIVSDTQVYVGQIINYTITVTNLAGFDAENVTVTDILDSALIYDNNNPNYNGTHWFVGNLSVGETKNITFNVTINATGYIWNNATVNSNLNDSNQNNNHVEVRILSEYQYADLSITKTVNKTNPFLGENVTFTITVTNNGAYNTENVTVYDPLPIILLYDGNNPNFNGTHWFVGNLTVGETKNITYTVTVDGIGIIWNNATVNSSLRDPNPNNNHAEVSLNVPVSDDLRIYINVIPNPPQANGNFIINISVWNRGYTDNNNVTVEFHLPPTLAYVNSTQMGAYNWINGTWYIGYLPNGAWTNLEIVVYPLTIDNITLECNVSGSVTDTAPENNRANITFEIIPAFDLIITKTTTNNTITDGEEANFEINLQNKGPNLARNIEIIDYLPTGTIYIFDNSSGIYNNISHTINWTIPQLNTGDNITIHLIIKSWGPGLTLTNKVTANAYGTDSNITDNTATVKINITQKSDLEIQLNASKIKDVDLGENITFYVTIINHGPSNATGITANFTLPYNFIYNTDNSTGSYNPINGLWTIGNLETNSNITLMINATLNTIGIIRLNATVNGTYYDNDTNNNIAFLNITATPVYDLNITAYWNLTDNTMPWNYLGNYTVIVSNKGPDNATNVTVRLIIPGVTYVTHNGAGILNTTTLIWDIGNLTVGETKNITITLNASTVGFFQTYGNITAYGKDNNTEDNNYTLNLTIIPVVDLIMTNITVNTTVTCVDGILEFNVTVFNRGPCNATNTTIVGLLPTGWNIVGGMTTGNVPFNSSEVFTILVNASTCGNFTVGFNATIKGLDTYPLDNNLTFETIEVIYACDLMITIKTDTVSTTTGDIVVYVITVSNLDWRTAHNVTANITIPTGLIFDHMYLSSGEYNPLNGTWTIGNMSYRNSTSLFLFTRSTNPNPIEFWVNVTGDDYDFHMWNNNDTVNITINPGLDLNITITVDNNTPYTGDNVTFTVIVENIGLINAENVFVDFKIPSGFINPSSLDLNFTGNSWFVGNLSTGSVKTLKFTLIPATTNNLTLNATVGASRLDYNMTNNFANITVSPIAATDLTVTITSNNSNPKVDENTRYIITVQNNGLIDVDNVLIYNNLPFSLTYDTSTPTYSPISKLWLISNLTKGSTETLNIRINHTTPGIYAYTVNITSATIDTNLSNNLNNITTRIIDENDLITIFTVTNNTILDEDILNFTITVYNNGTNNNTNVKVYTNLPSTNTYTDYGFFDTNMGIWEVGNLTAYENKTISILVNITQIGNYTFWANSTGDQKDKNTTNNNQSLNITIYTDYDITVNITVNNNSIYLGDTLNFTITVTNLGPSTTYNTNITYNITGTNTLINIGELKSNETRTYNILFTPTTDGIKNYQVNITADNLNYDRNITNNKDNITINVTSTVDLILNIISNTTLVNRGDYAEFNITIYNNGSNTANNVIIEYNNLFEGTILSSTVTNGFISPISWFIPTLTPYTLETLTIRRTINNNTLINTNVTSNTYELNKDNNYANITINITKLTDLQVTLTVNQTNAYIGDNITFTVTVINHGNDTAENITVKLDLPYSTQYTDTYMYDSLQGIWNIGTLENHTNKTLNITVTITQPGINIFNTTLNTITTDTNTSNNKDNLTVNITSILDLEITISSNITNTVYTGDLIEFRITVTNYGPSNATNTIANLNIPGTIFIPTKGTYASGTWNIGTLNTGETANLTIQRILQNTDNGTYNVNVTSNEIDKNLNNNNATIKIILNKSSDLEIRISSSTLTTNLGDTLYYTINLINNGPDNANSPIMKISLPNSFNIQSNMSNNGIFNGTHWILSNINTGLANMATLIIYGNYTGYGNQTTTAQVNSTNYDSNTTNNNANISIWIIPACDLIVNFTTTGYYNPDGTMTFNITILNNGPCNTTNVTLYTNLPATNDYNETYGYFDSIQNIWYIGDLTAGQSETLIINTTMISQTQYYANITSPTKELNTTNNIKYLNLTVTPIVDLSVNITLNNSNSLIGESITFLVTATNLGYYNATNVTVYTNLPSTTTYSISKGLFDTVYGNWSIGKLDVGEIATLEVTINTTNPGTFTYNVNITGSVNDTKTDNNNATITYNVNATSDIGIKVNINQTSLIMGDNVTFTINITNYGPSDAENITIEIKFPTGFNPDTITIPIGTYNNGTWNITTLNNGSTITLNITGILNTSGTQTFTANITNTLTYDNNTNNNYDSITFNINEYVDLTVNITSDNLTVFAGDYINIIINVTNNGPGNAENIYVNTQIFNATSIKDNGYYDKNTGYWFIENLTQNTTITLNLTLQITENTTYTVNLNTSNIESNLTNNNATLNITVNPLANLNITVNTNNNKFYENDTITYIIIVTNSGYSIAENVNTTINIPFTFISSNNTNYDNITGIWNIGNLNPKETQILTIKYQANILGNTTSYFNTTTTTLELNLTDNTINKTIFVDNATKPITNFVDLIVNITVDNSIPNINSTLTFNITVYNNATLTATNITITNYLPNGLTPIGTYTGNWTINNLTANENKSFTFTVNVTNYGSFVDNVTVDCNQWDINPTNNRANQLIIVNENKGDYLDLLVNITRTGNLTLNELVTYNITVNNKGPTDAYDVNVTIGLFEGLNLTSKSTNDYNETNSIWNVGNLSSGTSKTLILTLNITNTGLYTNIFLVWSNEMDKNPQNNLALDTFTINDTKVDVNIKITANRTYGKINDTIQLTVTVTNPSNNPATNVNITLDIPTDLEITNFTGYDNSSYYIGTLNSSQTVTFNFTVKINTTNTSTITANVTINETDHNLLDNTDKITITTITGENNGVADLTVNITTSLLNLTSGNMEVNQYPEYGDVPYFTVWVTNHGPDNATNIRVPLTVPNGCSIMAQDAYWDNTTESFIVSNLGVNQTIKLEVSMLIETTDVLLINTTATSDQFDPNITDNTATISMYPFIPEPNCDLNVTVKVIGNEFYANSTVTFNITIRNDGQDIAYNVTVRNTIPTGLIFNNITTYDTYTLNSDGWDIPQILPGASMQFIVTYNITKKGLYQTTVNANSTIQDTDPTSNGMGVAFYAGEAEPPRREVKTKLNSPTVTTTAGKVQLAGGDWTFVGTLKFANNTAAPSSYTNFAGQTLCANVTDDAGVTRTYVSSTVTGSDGKATFIVPHADVGAGGTKFSIVIWYKGEKTDTDYYLPCVSSAKNNIKVVP